MKPWVIRVALACATVSGASSLLAQGIDVSRESAQFREQISNAQKLETQGKLPEARQAYERAKADATEDATDAALQLRLGELTLKLAKDKAQAERAAGLREAQALFQQATRQGNLAQQVIAHNNLGATYLKTGRAEDAVAAFAEAADKLERSPDAGFRDAQRWIINFNWAQALGKANQPAEAVKRCAAVIRERPYQAEAIEAARQTLQKVGPDHVNQPMHELGKALLEAGRLPLAVEIAQENVRQYPQRAKGAVAVLVLALVRSDLAPENFQLRWAEPLATLRSHGFAQAADEIQAAYLARLEWEAVTAEFSSDGSKRWDTVGFGWWHAQDEELSVAFAELLRHTGDYFAGLEAFTSDEPRDAQQAAARYLLSWKMDRYNTQAAQNCAWLLAKHGHRWESGDLIFDILTEGLFLEKNTIYSRNFKTPDDWERILRMHYLLGTLYESKKIWGSQNEPASAIFQWTLAIAAEKKIREMGAEEDDGFIAPSLHERLAKAYVAVREEQKAFGHYLTAAEGYQQYHQAKAVERCVASAQSLRVPRLLEDERRMQQILRGLREP